MRLLLAPMEGVLDHTLRALLTDLGGYQRCVTEFLRVTDRALPARVFYRYCPELHDGGYTRAGTPVYLQLLGGQADAVAANARVAERLGAPGIDLNFGCPAKLVNRHDGGSALLREPARVAEVIRAVRDTVTAPVTAKIRLGFDDDSLFTDIAGSVAEAGANELCVHARTRNDGYKPPAHWHRVAKVHAWLPIPMIINGEIWTPNDARQARADSGCVDVMLGRGSLACPDLAAQLSCEDRGELPNPLPWIEICALLDRVLDAATRNRFAGDRCKQWLGYLRRHYADAARLFDQIKRLRDANELYAALYRHRRELDTSSSRY